MEQSVMLASYALFRQDTGYDALSGEKMRLPASYVDLP
jgi:hypothetical protein